MIIVEHSVRIVKHSVKIDYHLEVKKVNSAVDSFVKDPLEIKLADNDLSGNFFKNQYNYFYL